MAPKYKLIYFNVKALAEPIRMLFSYGKIEFEDYRFEKEDWHKYKPDMPFGQVPLLVVNGKEYHQSVAITRWLAKQVKLQGANDWEDLEIDSVVDTINDLRAKIAAYSYEANPEIKESLKGPLMKEILPFYLTRLEAIAKSNNGHMACGKLTWADFILAGWIDYLNYMVGSNILADYPNLQSVVDKVLKIPEVQSWVEKRPKTAL